LVVIATASSETQLRKIVLVLLWSLLVLELYAFYQVAIGDYGRLYEVLHPLDENSLPWEGRATSLLSHFNSWAGQLNLLLPFAFASALYGPTHFSKRLGAVVSVLALPALLFTQSRGGVIAFLGTAVVAILLISRSFKSRMKWLALIATLILSLTPLIIEYAPRLGGLEDEGGGMTRLAIFAAGWGVFWSHPFIGVGYGNFRNLFANALGVSMSNLDTHNQYLQLLAETGIAGLVAFMGLVVVTLREAHRQLRTGDATGKIIGFSAITALASVLIHGLVDTMFLQSPEYNATFWLIIALVVANSLRRPSLLSNPQLARI
jgi:putative inorganic carbon (HCO3(-)) transporter